MNLTPTQSRFLKLLSDGQPHTVEEFRELLWDDMAVSMGVIYSHICSLRKGLRSVGQGVLVEQEQGRPTTYRLVRFVTSTE